jgi:arsenate reductase
MGKRQMQPVIYHNPRCSKSRATLQLLVDQGFEPRVIQYLQTPPSPDQLEHIVKLLGAPVTDIIRFKEPAARDRGLSKTDRRDQREWLEILATTPILLERPIVVVGDKAAIGRPPDNVLAIL